MGRTADGAERRSRVGSATVRVPVVFRLCPSRDSKIVFSELVVYPDQPKPWDKETPLVAAGVPDWFDTWSQTVGLPLHKVEDPALLDAGNWRMPEKPGLLLLGRKAAGGGPAAICRFAAEHKINVLVLEADWFGVEKTAGAPGTPGRETALSPKQLTGPLADWQDQRWPLPPTFRRTALPWFAVANRQAWIASDEYPLPAGQDSNPSQNAYPLVEEIRSPQTGAQAWQVVLSYLPWQDQLGRCEVADGLFLRLLAATAKGAKDRRPLDGGWRLLYPAASEIKAGERPVLAAALKSAVGQLRRRHRRFCAAGRPGQAWPHSGLRPRSPRQDAAASGPHRAAGGPEDLGSPDRRGIAALGPWR